MILQQAELSPTQKTAIEETLGRQLLDGEAVSLTAMELDAAILEAIRSERPNFRPMP